MGAWMRRRCERKGGIAMTANLLRAMSIVVACGLAACTRQEANPNSGAGGTTGGGGNTGGAGTGSSGTTGSGGSGSGVSGVACLPPAQTLATFTFDPDGGSTTDGRFGDYGVSLSGGTSTY